MLGAEAAAGLDSGKAQDHQLTSMSIPAGPCRKQRSKGGLVRDQETPVKVQK